MRLKIKKIFNILLGFVLLIVLYLVCNNSINSNIDIFKKTLGLTDITSVNNSNLVGYDVERVVDGDTLVLNVNGESQKCRLLSVDTPESVSPDKNKNTKYGDMASNYTKSLLENVDTVYLQFDSKKKDTYGRMLAYVWLKGDVNTENENDIKNYMLNAILIENGYAVEWSSSENRQDYLNFFTNLRNIAQVNKVGLWQYNEFEDLEEK